ncbi:MAG: hypothetical protein M1834_009734 [Cirrosporium novae-zelandiae]|nr:MAG: hypothetical protein M1834_009734 [Cirrosporium novae-zelandiae]
MVSGLRDFCAPGSEHKRWWNVFLNSSAYIAPKGDLRAYTTLLKETCDNIMATVISKNNLNEDQIQAITKCVTASTGGVSVIRGAPGTGKTLVGSSIADIVLQMGFDVAVLAPTNSAANRFINTLAATQNKNYQRTIYLFVSIGQCSPDFKFQLSLDALAHSIAAQIELLEMTKDLLHTKNKPHETLAISKACINLDSNEKVQVWGHYPVSQNNGDNLYSLCAPPADDFGVPLPGIFGQKSAFGLVSFNKIAIGNSHLFL